MDISWDPQKERKLRKERGIDLREIADLILDGRYTAILENPSRPTQLIKFHQLYGKNHENKT
jgi:uncharacterized DUF497 family protein